MNAMTLEEFNSLCGNGRRGRHVVKAAQVIRLFMESGFEAAEIDPTDFGLECDTFGKAKGGYVRNVLNKQAVALKVDSMVAAYTRGGNVYLVRTDV